MTQVKICGITRYEDAHLAAALGASFLGFIFVRESPRFIVPELASLIVGALGEPRPRVVGVFRDAAPDAVREVAARVPLDLVQLHGDESDEHIEAAGVPAIKALRVGDTLPDTKAHPHAEWLLFDTHDARQGGGTGRRFNWTLLARYERRQPFFLAGGITPDNVAAAISRVRPQGIDVSSGVESAPGIKDAVKLQQLFERVRGS